MGDDLYSYYPDSGNTESYAPEGYGAYDSSEPTAPPQDAGQPIASATVSPNIQQYPGEGPAGGYAGAGGPPPSGPPGGMPMTQPMPAPTEGEQAEDDLEAGYIDEDQIYKYVPQCAVGELVVRIRKLQTSETKNIYCNIRTMGFRGPIITRKIRSELYDHFNGETGFTNDEFVLEFKKSNDKLVIHNWKKKSLMNKNLGKLTVEIRNLMDPIALTSEKVSTYEMIPKGTIDLGIQVRFKRLHRIGALLLGKEIINEGTSCLLLVNMTIQFTDITGWVEDDEFSENIATNCLKEMFLQNNMKHSLQGLCQLRGKAMKFPGAAADACFDKYGVRVLLYKVIGVVNRIPDLEVLEKARGYVVYNCYRMSPGTMLTVQHSINAYDFYLDALKAYPTWATAVSVGFMSQSVTSREVVFKDYVTSMGPLIGGFISIQLANRYSAILQTDYPRFM